MPEDFRAKLGAKQMKFDEDSLTKKKKGNKTTILKCPIVATIFFRLQDLFHDENL